MNCEDAREGVSAQLDGALPAGEREALESHVAGCAACRAFRVELADVRTLLRGVDDLDEPVSRAAAVGKGVLARIEEDPGRKREKWMVFVGIGVVAACAMIVAGIAWHYRPREESEHGPAPVLREPSPAFHGHLELRAADAATRDALRELFRQWRGTSSLSQPEAGPEFAFAADFDGPDDPAFLERLRAFQRDHGLSIRSWKFSSSTR
ncbi:MAG: zf-HC2 domain-containing protein [Planctomycetes bacterium]|nr:zf-HC2 domain-containing protein [Planctomycetota bacterium]